MNIEESDIEKAFPTVRDCLEVVHFADSNRRALGQGISTSDLLSPA